MSTSVAVNAVAIIVCGHRCYGHHWPSCGHYHNVVVIVKPQSIDKLYWP